MKFVPSKMSLFDNAFDDLFNDSFFRTNSGVMKTDIKEKDGSYLLDVELPGFKKEDIHLNLENGYLTIEANHNIDNSEKDQEGNVIRRERSYGSCSRSFYVGDAITEEEIKAKYENGELKIFLPKKDMTKAETKKTILID